MYRDVPGNEEGEMRSNVARIAGGGAVGVVGVGLAGLDGWTTGVGSLDDASLQLTAPMAMKAANVTMNRRDTIHSGSLSPDHTD